MGGSSFSSLPEKGLSVNPAFFPKQQLLTSEQTVRKPLGHLLCCCSCLVGEKHFQGGSSSVSSTSQIPSEALRKAEQGAAANGLRRVRGAAPGTALLHGWESTSQSTVTYFLINAVTACANTITFCSLLLTVLALLSCSRLSCAGHLSCPARGMLQRKGTRLLLLFALWCFLFSLPTQLADSFWSAADGGGGHLGWTEGFLFATNKNCRMQKGQRLQWYVAESLPMPLYFFCNCHKPTV